MKLVRAQYARHYNEPLLVLEFKESTPEKAFILADVARELKRGVGVFLGMDWEEVMPTFQAGQDNNTLMKGYTKDEQIIELARRFTEDLSTGTFKEGETVFDATEDDQ